MRCGNETRPTKIGRAGDNDKMDYEAFFAGHLRRLHDEGRYRVFAELERIVGAFPRARLHREGAAPRDVTVWCSNDYLAMGQHPVVIEAMQPAIDAQGSGAGGTRNISGTNRCTPPLERELADRHRQGSGAGLHLGLCRQRDRRSQTLGKMLPGCEHLFRRAEPRLDDRRHPPLAARCARLPPQ